MKYKLYGLIVQSNIEFPQLLPDADIVSEHDVDISIVRPFLLGNALAIMLTQRGKIVIHGSIKQQGVVV